MSLTDAQRTRFARHLLLPELGETGQERLLAGRVQFAADADDGAVAVARDYLARAGVAEGKDRDLSIAGLDLRSIEALAGQPEWIEAARALAGAFAAVEAIKTLAGIGTKGALDAGLRLAPASDSVSEEV